MKYIVIILFLLISAFPSEKADFKVVSSSTNGITLEYYPVYIDNVNYGKIQTEVLPLFSNCSDPVNLKPGAFDYRYRGFLIGLPDLKGTQVTVTETSYDDISNVSLKKINDASLENGVITEKPGGKFFGHEYNYKIADLTNIGISRDQITATLRIFPYEYITKENKVRIYKKIRVHVSFTTIHPNLTLNSVRQNDIPVINKDIANNWTLRNIRINKAPYNSVLNSGSWYKIKTTEEGIYKLDYNFLKNKGIDLSNVDPKTIKIFGNGGKNLDEMVESQNPDDLVENAIIVVGEEDAKFDQNDYILFFANGMKGFNYNSSSKSFSHYYNYYSDNNIYWITFGGNTGKRMQVKSSLTNPSPFKLQTTTGFILNHELKYNVIKSGKQWFGDQLLPSTPYKVYNNKLPGLVSGQNINYRISLLGRGPSPSSFKVEESSTLVGTVQIADVDMTSLFDVYGHIGVINAKLVPPITDSRSILKITYNYPTQTSEGYLDYFEITYPRYLQADADKFSFFSPDTSSTVEYRITNFSNSDIKSFDITDPVNTKIIGNPVISGGEIKFQSDEISGNNPSKYLIIGQNGYNTPAEIIRVSNQNLHGITDGAEFIIITPTEFLSEAERLKTYKQSRTIKPIKTTVIDLNQIYNEFSGGIPDLAAIRDFLKFAYKNWNTKPFYVLLLGDGSYDYRNIEGYGKNFIPYWETLESLSYLDTYATDDFYAKIIGNDYLVDLSIGRLTVQNQSEAKACIDKIINYENGSDKGEWRNLISFVADDGKTSGNGDDGALHTSQSETLSNTHTPDSFIKNKIYLILYPTVETSIGRRKPLVNKAIVDAVNSGSLILNFIGHGNPEVWAHENVFEKMTTIPQLTNQNKLFFLVAATCDFGNCDNPSTQSSAEMLIAKKDGGAIAGLTSCRVVISHENFALASDYYYHLLGWRNTGKEPPTIGKAYYNTKLNKNSTNDQKYLLFGDPTLTLLFPKMGAAVDSVNKKAVQGTIEIKSLSNTELSGTLRDSMNNIAYNFNGEANIAVYDAKKIREIQEWGKYKIYLEGGIVFKGRSQIKNGMFRTSFMIPKDVSYESNFGKITLYCSNGSSDALGFNGNILILASDTASNTDRRGPDIELFLDNKESAGAGLVNQSPLLIVKLKDESGLNTTGTGLGHNIEAVLNDDIYNPVDLSASFVGDLDQGNKKGEVNYKFKSLPVGKYDLKVTAWDVFNNPSNSNMTFEVIEDGLLGIKYIYNVPNPMKEQTTFTFHHSYSDEVDVKIKIYTLTGRLINTLESNNLPDKFVKLEWNGRDKDGDMVGNGVYLYKIIIKNKENQTQEALGKLVIIR